MTKRRATENKSCNVCSTIFVSTYSRALFCSDSCREEANRRRANRFKGKSEVFDPVARCQVCDGSFRRPNPNARYCSKLCRSIGKRLTDAKPLSNPLKFTLCRICNRDMIINGRAVNVRYCPACFKKAKAAIALRSYHKARAPIVAATVLVCKTCGDDFRPTLSRKSRRVYCSDVCFKRRPDGQYTKLRESHIRRARYYKVDYEPINKKLVFERDGWMCGLCDKPINPKLRSPDPKSASLDHVVPLSKGGGHVYANVQATHLTCNKKKHNRSKGEQLRLIG